MKITIQKIGLHIQYRHKKKIDKQKEGIEMEEEKKDVVEKSEEEKVKEKKNTFTLIYILVGIFAIIVLAMLAYAFIVSK